MSVRFYRLRQMHRFLARQSLFPILLSSLLAVGLFATVTHAVVGLVQLGRILG